MAERKLLSITVLDIGGFPLIIYDPKEGKIDLDKVLKAPAPIESSLLVAAIHGLTEKGEGTTFVETEEKKYILTKKGNFIVSLAFSKKVDTYDINIQLFAKTLINGLIKIHKIKNIGDSINDVGSYLKEIGPMFTRFVKKLMRRLYITA
ncbi:MAG: hypothetical protein ACP6IQ_09300 [Candidatus Njordarchaeia archaeon]